MVAKCSWITVHSLLHHIPRAIGWLQRCMLRRFKNMHIIGSTQCCRFRRLNVLGEVMEYHTKDLELISQS
uniref:Uncharacterized protein n=1 Tax=Arundo donax TaxID=35708 RepID=A0A0A9HJD5_ARUDO